MVESRRWRSRAASMALGVMLAAGVGTAAWQAPQTPAGGAAGRGRGQQPSRDTSAQPTQDQQQQQQPAVNATGRISGRVAAADTGSAVRGARVSVNAQQASRSLVTDATGLFDFTGLPAGRYTLSVSKTGFITLAYGQRRPLQPGTPLQLSDGQRLEGIEMRLPRGSAIAGHVFDENGEPLPNTMVRVMRYQYQQGERRLTMAGTGQTDDKGQYRVWGLNPGDYYVSAVMPNLGSMLDQLGGRIGGPGGAGRGGGPNGGPGGGRGGGQGGQGGQAGQTPGQPAAPGGRGQAAAGRGAGGFGDVINMFADPNFGGALAAAGLGNVMNMFGSALDGSTEPIAYAPTYYPGVSSASDAQMITVGLGAEALNIDFGLMLVRTSTVSGRVSNPDGSAVAIGQVNLSADGSAGRGGGPFGENFAGRVQGDGTFSIANVPPGRYTLRARSNPGAGGGPGGRGGRGGRGGAAGAPGTPGAAGATTDPAADRALPLFASQSITVGGSDITDLSIALSPGATMTGSVSVPPSQSGTRPNNNQMRVTVQAADSDLGTNFAAQIQADGTFTIQGIPAGAHWIRANAPRGMTLKAVTIGGRDVIDEPFEVRAGESVDNVTLVFTDRVSEINGTVTDAKGAPVTDYTVLAFAEDSRLWRPQSRQIQTSRPDQNGKFQIRGLPPGRYYLATVDPAVNGEWFEPAFLEQHRDTAARVSLAEGETRTQDFKLR